MLCVVAGVTALFTVGVGSAAASKLYWGTYTGPVIGTLDAAGNGVGGRDLITDAGRYRGGAVDAAAGRIYWLDPVSHVIRYANLDGTGQSTLAIGGASVSGFLPGGLQLDPGTGTLYWSNSKLIEFAKTDGSGGGTLYTLPVPEVFAIDPAANRIYFAAYWDSAITTITFANLDGSGGGGTITPSGTCDTAIGTWALLANSTANTLYRIGLGSASPSDFAIQQMRLDGSQCETLADSTDFPTAGLEHGATFDPAANRLIWGNRVDGTLFWLNLSDRTNGTYDKGEASVVGAMSPTLLAAPTATTAPIVTPASSTAGATLTCADPTWSSGIPGMNVAQLPSTGNTYMWTLNGTPVTGATGATLATTTGGSYACSVTAGNAAGAATATSAAVTVTSTAKGKTPKVDRQSGLITVSVTTTGPGSVLIDGVLGGSARAARRACRVRFVFAKAGTRVLRCIPSPAAQRLRKKGPVRIRVKMTFTPKGGTAVTRTLGDVTLTRIKTHPPEPVVG